MIGSYDYEEQLVQQMKQTERQINNERVIKGKLVYLQKMFAEIEIGGREYIEEERGIVY